MRKLSLLLALFALVPFALAACGGDDDDDEAAAPPPPPTEKPAGDKGGAGKAVQVSADPGGGFAFEQETLQASAGSVSFEFTNDASLAHDFCIEQDGETLDCTEQSANFSDTLEIDLEAGDYLFYCSVAGHRDGGMEGELTVE